MSTNPSPAEIRAGREAAGLSQTAAAELIHSKLRTWQDWESGKASMHPGLWALFSIRSADAAPVGDATPAKIRR